MIKAAFFDIDGTLLSHQLGGVPDSAKAAIHALHAQGVKTFIATGRHITSLEQVEAIRTLPFDGYVTLNGQYCVSGDTVIYDRALDPADVMIMKEYVKAHPLALGFMEARANYVNRYTSDLRRVHEIIRQAPPPIGDLEAGCKNKVYQMVLYASSEEIDKLPALVHTDMTRWILGGVDMMPKGGSKAVGIAHVLAHYGVARSEAIAFGDGENDIEMFGAVGTSIAMGNAPQHVKQRASMTTDSVEEDGIYHALVRLNII